MAPTESTLMTIDPLSNRVSYFSTSADSATCARYIELHALIPAHLERWSEAQLRELLLAARMTMRDREWERALLLLAHHRSRLAADLLREAKRHVPPRLQGFWELACRESRGWLEDEAYWRPGTMEL